jgi:hypothetical protein
MLPGQAGRNVPAFRAVALSPDFDFTSTYFSRHWRGHGPRPQFKFWTVLATFHPLKKRFFGNFRQF